MVAAVPDKSPASYLILPQQKMIADTRHPACSSAASQPAHGAAGTRLTRASKQDAVVRSRGSSLLDDPARAGIDDDLAAPRSAAERLEHFLPRLRRRVSFVMAGLVQARPGHPRRSPGQSPGMTT